MGPFQVLRSHDVTVPVTSAIVRFAANCDTVWYTRQAMVSKEIVR